MDPLAPGSPDDGHRPLYKNRLVLFGLAFVAFAFLAPAAISGLNDFEARTYADLDRAQAEYAARQADRYDADLPPDDHPLAERMGMEPVYDQIRLERALERHERRELTRATVRAAERPDAPRVLQGATYGEVLRAAGEPDGLSAGGGVETWRYRPTRGRRWRLTVRFRNGRVESADPPAEALDEPGPGAAAPAVDSEPASPQPTSHAAMLQGGTSALERAVVYPDLARRAGIEGVVEVGVTVGADGRPSEPYVIRSPNQILSDAAVEAVMSMEWLPAREGSDRVASSVTVPVRFR